MSAWEEYPQDNISIRRDTKGRIPNLPFREVKNAILGKAYELSLVFPDGKVSENLHVRWKKKEGPVNILSFPLDENTGEIFITLSQARKEAKKFERTYFPHLLFLFIHGCLHLKGMKHGAKMEKEEKKFFRIFLEKYEQNMRRG